VLYSTNSIAITVMSLFVRSKHYTQLYDFACVNSSKISTHSLHYIM